MDGEKDRDDVQREAVDDRRHYFERGAGADGHVAMSDLADAAYVTELTEVTDVTQDLDARAATEVAQAAGKEADALAEHMRAAAEGQALPEASFAKALPAIRRATVVRPDGRVDGRRVGALPVALRRAAVATRDSLRNPAVAASVAALASVAAQVGLRLLDQRAQARVTAQLPAATRPPVLTVSQPPVRGWVRVIETRSVTIQHVTQHPPYGHQHPPY